MKVYRIVYRREGSDYWWDFVGGKGTGLYTELKTARSITTGLINKRWNTVAEAAILESDTEWATVEFKERNGNSDM